MASAVTDHRWTPTQQRIIDLLSDGMPHDRYEIFGCLDDNLSKLSAIWFHMSSIRRVVRPRGEDILCVLFDRKIHYQHVKLLCGIESVPTSPQRKTVETASPLT
jgi:hypothetical protein